MAISQFTREAINHAALDTCCSNSVAGKEWLDIYINSLNENIRKKLRGPMESNRVFKFGNNGKLTSQGLYILPCIIAGKSCTIEVDVVKSDILLLLSKKAMKKAKMKIDLENDKCAVFGKEIELKTTSSGHYCISVLEEMATENDTGVDWVLAVDLSALSNEDKIKAIDKLHKQMGHHPKDRFVKLLKDANAWYDGAERHIEQVIESLTGGCLLLKRNPEKPNVSMPNAHGLSL